MEVEGQGESSNLPSSFFFFFFFFFFASIDIDESLSGGAGEWNLNILYKFTLIH